MAWCPAENTKQERKYMVKRVRCFYFYNHYSFNVTFNNIINIHALTNSSLREITRAKQSNLFITFIYMFRKKMIERLTKCF